MECLSSGPARVSAGAQPQGRRKATVALPVGPILAAVLLRIVGVGGLDRIGRIQRRWTG